MRLTTDVGQTHCAYFFYSDILYQPSSSIIPVYRFASPQKPFRQIRYKNKNYSEIKFVFLIK
jgi:hypothetical protein